MKSKFLELCSLILGCGPLDGRIEKEKDFIIKNIQQYNEKLNARGNSEFKSFDGEVILPPVPFASTGPKCKVVIVGLNPKFDKGHAAAEKQRAGEDWDRYADFYTSSRTFRYVMEEKSSRYYTNKVKLLYALKEGKVITINAIRAHYKSNNDYIPFSELTNQNPVLFAEFIPFHSANFKTISEINEAYGSDSLGFKQYMDELINVIREATDAKGLIIMDGKNPSRLFEVLKKAELKELHKSEDEKYRIYDWKGKKVLVTDGVIFGMSTPFNSHDYIEEMIRSLHNFYPEFEMLPTTVPQ